MARTADLDDIVTSATIARRLFVRPSTVDMWRKRYDTFPAPLDVPGVSGTHLWLWSEVKAWRAASEEARPSRAHRGPSATQELVNQGALYPIVPGGPRKAYGRPRYLRTTLQRIVDEGRGRWAVDHKGADYVEEVQR